MVITETTPNTGFHFPPLTKEVTNNYSVNYSAGTTGRLSRGRGIGFTL